MTADRARPNILYVICHDLGKHLSCYGAKVPSPNLERFADEGVKFVSNFCNSTACSPSRGCGMSGKYAHTNGLMGLVNCGWSMPLETKTIVDYLNDEGYETAHFGFQHERHRSADNRYQIERDTRLEDHHCENAIDQAIGYLEGRPADAPPFYVNIGTVEVHTSRWQGTFPWDRGDVYTPDAPQDVYVPPYIPDVPQVRKALGKFQGAIRHLDTHFQRLVDAIDRLGLKASTLVVFTTDHGIAANRSKTTLYDRGMEITLLMQMPGVIGRGDVVQELTQNIDVAPTLLEAVGAPIPAELQGESFWKRLTGGDYVKHDAIFTERNYHDPGNPNESAPVDGKMPGCDPMRAVRTERFHYIKNFDPSPKREWGLDEVTLNESYEGWWTELWPPPALPRDKEELYDVVNDPDEFTNLAGDPQYAEIKAELSGRLDEWMRRTNDPLLNGPIPDRMNPWPDGWRPPSD